MPSRVFDGLKPVPDYRIWIYSVNGLIISFQIVVIVLGYLLMSHPYWSLIPISPNSSIVIAFALVFFVQWIACFSAIVGVFISSREFIKVYWLLMIPLFFIDIIKFAVASYTLMQVHMSLMSPVTSSDSLCAMWIEFAREYSCSTECLSTPTSSCSLMLLRWMHSRLDHIGIIMCFVLFPLKLIVILVLREDIQELFEEIIYSKNQLLYKHWALGDEEDMMDRCLREQRREEGIHETDTVFGA